MNISSIKAISCADTIDWIDTHTIAAPLFRSFSGQSPLGAELHHDEPAEVRKYCQGVLQVIPPRDLLGSPLVGKKNIHESQYIENIVRPLPVRIVIRVQRCCEPLCFRVAKYLGRPGSQRAVEKIRREVKMASRKNVVDVKIRVSQLGHRPGISQNISVPGMGQYHGESGRRPAGCTGDTGHVYATVREPVERRFA